MDSRIATTIALLLQRVTTLETTQRQHEQRLSSGAAEFAELRRELAALRSDFAHLSQRVSAATLAASDSAKQASDRIDRVAERLDASMDELRDQMHALHLHIDRLVWTASGVAFVIGVIWPLVAPHLARALGGLLATTP